MKTKFFKLTKSKPFLFLSLFLFSILGYSQGHETFNGFTATGTNYQTGTFTGQDGSAWSYVNARGDLSINGKSLTLQNNNSAKLESGLISGGIGTLQFSYKQSFSNNVNLNVFVNDVLVGNVITNGEQNVVKSSGIINVNIDGDFTIKFEHQGSGAQVTIDDIIWTAGNPIVAEKLIFDAMPATIGIINEVLPTFTVKAVDNAGNLDTFYTGSITLSKESGPGNLSGTLTANFTAGIATFSDIEFDSAGTYKIKAESGIFPAIFSDDIVITEPLDACFEEDFSDITSGDNTTTGGSGTAWTGNANFPTVDRAYQAGGAVKLGTGSAIGSITSQSLDFGGDITVKISVKGWTNVEGDLKVSIDGQDETLNYSAKMADPFEEVTASFYGVAIGSNLKIETSAKRAFIDNVEIICTPPADEELHFRTKTSGGWASNTTWESSTDGTTWATTTSYPGENALSVNILSDHTIELNVSDLNVNNTTVYGTLVVNDNNFKVSGNINGYGLIVENGGVFKVGGKGYDTNESKKGLIKDGGRLWAVSVVNGTDFATHYINGNTSTNSSLFTFENNSIFDWDSSITLASTNYNYFFRTVNSTDLVIFRLTKNFPNETSNYGGGTNNIFNAVIEVTGENFLRLSGAGNKTFRGGIQGEGSLKVTYDTGSGKLILGDTSTVPTLGSNGILNIEIPHNTLQLVGGLVPATAEVRMKPSTPIDPIHGFVRTSGTFTIDGILDMNVLRLTNSESMGGTILNGTLRTAHEGGLYNTGSAIPSGIFTLSNGSTVVYNGNNQAISSRPYYHIVFAGNGIKTTTGARTIHENGSVTITDNAIVDFSNANLGSNLSEENTATLTMDGGRLILGLTGTKPMMRGIYDITGGVVEFVNNGTGTAQTIRNTEDHPYFNIEVSGTNVGNSGGNLYLNSGGSFTVLSGGEFSIRQRSIKCVVDNDCSVTVKNNAVFNTGNTKGFSGHSPPAEIGNDDSAIHENVTNITLENGSTVDYISTSTDQIVSEFSPGYYNLKVSGDKAFIEDDILVNNTVELTADGKVEILSEGSLSVKDKITNLASAERFIVRDGGNLLQENNVTNTGNIQVEKLFTFSTGRQQYNFISSPVDGQDIKTIFGPDSSIPYALLYNTETDYFVYPSQLGKGYSEKLTYAIKEEANLSSNAQTAILKGGISNGNISYELSTEGGGFNVVGNPYPSNVDLKEVYNSNSTKISSDFWFWDNRGNTLFEQQGPAYSNYTNHHYALYNAASGTNGMGTVAPGVSGSEIRIPNQYATVGTGFMIKATTADNLIFSNSHRTKEKADAVFFGKGQNFNTVDDRYWLTMTTPGNIEVMNAVVYFEGGDDAYGIDDSKGSGGSDELYTLVDDYQLVIQGKAPFNNKDVVPLGYRAFAPGFHTISIYKSEGVFEDGQKIYIKDNLLGTTHDLTLEDFVFKTAPGEFNDRFEIIYKKSHKASDNQAKLANVIIQRKDHNIQITSEELKIVDVEVYDLNGSLVHSQKGINAYELKIPNTHFNKQLLIVVVKTEDGQVLNKKLINN